jgi:hypothetical protein
MPNTETQILHDLTYIWNLKEVNSWKQRTEWLLPGTREVRRENLGKAVQRI